MRADVHSIPVWIQFPFLPLKYWGEENMCRLASQLGSPLDVDDLTVQHDKGQFARIKVLMEIKEEVLELVKYADEYGRMCEQNVHFEWLPVKCRHCKRYEHMSVNCRKPNAQQWVPKKKIEEPKQDVEGWQTIVSKKNKGQGSSPPEKITELKGLAIEGSGGTIVEPRSRVQRPTKGCHNEQPDHEHFSVTVAVTRKGEEEMVDKGGATPIIHDISLGC